MAAPRPSQVPPKTTITVARPASRARKPISPAGSCSGATKVSSSNARAGCRSTGIHFSSDAE